MEMEMEMDIVKTGCHFLLGQQLANERLTSALAMN